MKNNYLLSPFLTISLTDNKEFELQNLLFHNKRIKIKSFKELNPDNQLVRELCFIRRTPNYWKKEFLALEKFFKSQKNAVGYIETTARCPYHCKICPKGFNKQKRKCLDMPSEKVNAILKQIRNQPHLALHLFGDPLCDGEIYTKIELANKNGVIPSFSTNLISLKNLDLIKIKKLKLKYLTISFDSSNYLTMSVIRGKTRLNDFNEGLAKLKELVTLAEKTDCIEYIIIQKIQLNNNDDDLEIMKKFVNSSSKMLFIRKRFIRFPGVKRYQQFGTSERLEVGRKILLYHLLGVKTPFKCLKAWIKSEVAITSDGNYSPCCISLNPTENLGNMENLSLNEFFNSQNHYKFREKIFFDKFQQKHSCFECSINKPNIEVPQGLIDRFELERLKKLVIGDWRE